MSEMSLIEKQKEDQIKYQRYLMTFDQDSHIFDVTTMGLKPLSFKELFGYELENPETSEQK